MRSSRALQRPGQGARGLDLQLISNAEPQDLGPAIGGRLGTDHLPPELLQSRSSKRLKSGDLGDDVVHDSRPQDLAAMR